MDDPNITIEEYIRLKEEKARRRGKVYNWETAMYGKIWYDEDVHDRSHVNPRIMVDDLKTDLEIDNDRVNMPSFSSSEPTVSYFDDFDYFKNFEKEFLAIGYNDALTSKLDFSEPTVSPQHIDEFDETSFSKCDGGEQNIIYFNYIFPFNVIYLDDLSDKDNDNDKIDIEQSSGDLSIEPLPTVIKSMLKGQISFNKL
uniref:Uncharacterized protein n=1 Tax=Tanacetum cinerariifolium TaxID=118510 RepID=A0A699GSR0_TANCI|nr:hypothetical protein [Tanacetum cinerariifolium]